MGNKEYVFQGFAGIAALSSLLVVLTCILFPSMIKSSIMMQLIFMISLCEFLSTIQLAMFGYPDADSIECLTQGFFLIFFSPPAWIFTTFLCYQLRCIFIDKKVWLNLKWILLITATITCLLTFVPLLFGSKYGEDSVYSNHEPCNITGQNYTLFYDIWLGFSLINVIIMSYFSIQVFNFVKKEGIGKAHRMYNIYQSIIYYSFGLIVAWLPTLVMYYMFHIGTLLPSSFNATSNIIAYLATSYGTFSSIIFFSNSERARNNWKKIFFKSKDDDVIFFIEDNEENKDRYLNELDYDVDENVISPPLDNESRDNKISTRSSLEVSLI
jgi:hypothetical protein